VSTALVDEGGLAPPAFVAAAVITSGKVHSEINNTFK
jgi:hypothetical protein